MQINMFYDDIMGSFDCMRPFNRQGGSSNLAGIDDAQIIDRAAQWEELGQFLRLQHCKYTSVSNEKRTAPFWAWLSDKGEIRINLG